MNPLTRSVSPWLKLQTELRDLAFVLDRQGSYAAADVAVTIAARIDELLVDESSPALRPQTTLQIALR